MKSRCLACQAILVPQEQRLSISISVPLAPTVTSKSTLLTLMISLSACLAQKVLHALRAQTRLQTLGRNAQLAFTVLQKAPCQMIQQKPVHQVLIVTELTSRALVNAINAHPGSTVKVERMNLTVTVTQERIVREAHPW